MNNYTQYTIETAPQGSKPVLENVQTTYGFIPNLLATFAESPVAVEAYATLSGIFEKSDFTATERQIVLMTNNRLNDCTYCMAAHTTISKMQKISEDVIEALRNGTSLSDTKLEALRIFTANVVENRGNVNSADVEAFIAAGYTRANVLEVIVGTSLKVMSNYTNHIAETPVDLAFQRNAWSANTIKAA